MYVRSPEERGAWIRYFGEQDGLDKEARKEGVEVRKPDYSWIRELDVYSPEEREAWIRYFEEADEVDGATDVNPSHYDFPGGVQVIDITKHLDFLRGNAVKYLCRAGRKGDELTDLQKARQYIDWAIEEAERHEDSN